MSVEEVLKIHGEAILELWMARIALERYGWKEVLRAAERIGRRSSQGEQGESGDQSSGGIREVERALYRMSRLCPGATCIHRALAAQRLLARRSVGSRVVIGLRKRQGVLEGHAWLEVARTGAVLFVSADAGYREVFDGEEIRGSLLTGGEGSL